MGTHATPDTPEGRGRVAHALKTAKALRDSGETVAIHFDGAGVLWLQAFDRRDDKFVQHYGAAFDEVKDLIAGACNFCTTRRFKVAEHASNLGVVLHGADGEHGTLAPLLADGYQVITF